MGYYITDVGSKLYKNLTENNINWYPMLRSNKVDLHPVFFAVYDNIIYHHGAGFRENVTSKDLNLLSFHRIKKHILKFEKYLTLNNQKSYNSPK